MMAKKLQSRFYLLLIFFFVSLLLRAFWINFFLHEFECEHFMRSTSCSLMYYVNVQVQHTHLTDTAAADHATVELIVNTLHKFFPSFDYRYFNHAIGCLELSSFMSLGDLVAICIARHTNLS